MLKMVSQTYRTYDWMWKRIVDLGYADYYVVIRWQMAKSAVEWCNDHIGKRTSYSEDGMWADLLVFPTVSGGELEAQLFAFATAGAQMAFQLKWGEHLIVEDDSL